MGHRKSSFMRVMFALFLALSACSTPIGGGPLAPPAPPSPVQRCINLSNALEGPTEGAWGYVIRFDHIDTIAAAGFDTVRVPMRWSAHAGTKRPYRLDAAFLARSDAVIDYALSKGLKVIINVHHYEEINRDPEAHEARLAAIWSQLSAHYASYPETLIFELLNEPNSEMTVERTDALNYKLLRGIRRSQPDRWVILATADWGGLRGLLASRPRAGHRTILTFHYYDPFDFTHQGAHFVNPPLATGKRWGEAAQKAMVVSDFQKVSDFRKHFRRPVLLGEFGVYETVPMEQRADWVEHVRREAEKAGVGWCHWGFTATFNAYDDKQETWIEPIRAALLNP
jgi:endoglucanase